MPSQNEYNVAKQNGRIIHTKIFLLNYKLQKVDELSGVVLDGATFNIDATSDIRRTCSISLIPKDSSFDIKFGGKIWLDKYVQIFIGIEDIKNNNEVVYTNMGIYLINNPSHVYDATNNTITINGIDIMELEDAVQALWKEKIYAESGMGCTGPIVMVNESKLNDAIKVLSKAGFAVGEPEDC